MTDRKAKSTSGAMMSKVGNPQVYVDGDQRHSPPKPTMPNPLPLHEKPELLAGGLMDAHHILDPKENTHIHMRYKEERKEERKAEEAERHKTVDAQLQREDEEELLAKGPYNGTSHNVKHKHEHVHDES